MKKLEIQNGCVTLVSGDTLPSGTLSSEKRGTHEEEKSITARCSFFYTIFTVLEKRFFIILFQADFFGHVAHAFNGFRDQVVDVHVQHAGACFDDSAVDTGGEALVLPFLLDR